MPANQINKPNSLKTDLPSNKPTKNSSMKVVLMAVGFGFLAGILGGYISLVMGAKFPSTIVNESRNVVLNEENATISVAEKVGPSVVSIVASNKAVDLFGRVSQQSGAGTGIIISADGMILTNKHVVEGGDTFSVFTSDTKEYKNAKLIAKDPSNDIAFLKVDAKDLKPAELGDSSKIQIGQKVIAIGNALGQFQNTVTTGIISGKSRPITASDGQGSSETLQNLLQTDAAINPGNSGGPLVNIEGQVIGINTAVAGDAENIGFAIPINEAKNDISSIQEKGRIVRAYIGVRYVPITKEIAARNELPFDYGVLIRGSNSSLGVVSGSPADKAGLRESDIILKINGEKIDENNSLASAISKNKVGDTVTLTIWRDGKEQEIKVQLAESPANL